jgi:hypothetical protein
LRSSIGTIQRESHAHTANFSRAASTKPVPNCAALGRMTSLARIHRLSSERRVAMASSPIGVSRNSSCGSALKEGENCTPLTIACRYAVWIGSAPFSCACSQLHGVWIL